MITNILCSLLSAVISTLLMRIGSGKIEWVGAILGFLLAFLTLSLFRQITGV